MRQKAWLDASIEPIKGQHINRAVHLEKIGSPVNYPKVDMLTHLKQWIIDLGIYGYGLNGCIPLSFQEIHAWSELTRSGIEPREVGILRNLSRVYCSQYYKSDIKCPPPYMPKGNDDKIAMGQSFLAVLDSVNNVSKI